jgi:hypothetical protein
MGLVRSRQAHRMKIPKTSRKYI